MANPSRTIDLALEVSALNGSPQFLGVVVSTSATSKNNHSTATPFNNTGVGLGAKLLLLQPDVACYVVPGTDNTIAAVATATSSSFYLGANERVILNLKGGEGWLAVVAASGTVNLKVWELV